MPFSIFHIPLFFSYTHYPTISTDMFRVVKSRKAQFNNDARVASSAIRTHAKLFYYRVFAALYVFFFFSVFGQTC